MQIDFWVEASLEVGMGHLTRSAKVYKALQQRGYAGTFAGSLDEAASSLARLHGLPIKNHPERSSDMVMIDGLNAEESVQEKLRSYPIRGSLTEMPSAPDLPTHYFLRSHPSQARRETAKYLVEPGFALSGVQFAPIRELSFDDIHVGLCLSAGQGRDEWTLSRRLLGSASIRQLSVISRSYPPASLAHDNRLKHSVPYWDPWGFFEPINVFVGSDGVMLGEALERGLPVFSITDEVGYEKNRALADSGAISVVRRDLLEDVALGGLVTDPDTLKRLRERSVCFVEKGARFGLAEAMIRVREGTHVF